MHTYTDLYLAHPLETWTPFDIVVNSAYALLTKPTNVVISPFIRYSGTSAYNTSYFFWKFKRNSYLYSITYKFEPRQERNTSFQKRKKCFFVFGNSYFASPTVATDTYTGEVLPKILYFSMLISYWIRGIVRWWSRCKCWILMSKFISRKSTVFEFKIVKKYKFQKRIWKIRDKKDLRNYRNARNFHSQILTSNSHWR